MATLVCFIGGIAFYSRWLESSIRQTVQDQVLYDNIQTAKQLTRLVREMDIHDIRDPGSWARLQDVVEDIELPNEGFVCVVDSESGMLLCHPELRNRPELRQMPVGKSELRTGERRSDINTAAATSNGEIAAGLAAIKGEVHVLAVSHLPQFGANVLVHQRESGINTAIERIMWPVRSIGYSVAALATIFVVMVNVSIVRRYENRLANVNEHLEDMVRQRTRSLMRTRNAVIFGLAKLAESRDTDTGSHLERIRAYVTALAKRLRKRHASINKAFVDHLALASSLHDIGKVGIPDSILLKPGRFTADERQIMERHSAIGGDCLAAIQGELGDDDFLSLATEVAYFHHEKWDGTGYPQGKAGEEIPISARIVALADVYDALTSKRPYKEAMSHALARKIILEGRGTHFDPVVVDAFVKSEQEFIDISRAARDEETTLTAIQQLCDEAKRLQAHSATAQSVS